MNLSIFNFDHDLFSLKSAKIIRRKLICFVPFMLAFSLVLLFPLFVLVQSGEITSLKTVIHRQSESPQDVFFGRAYTGVDQYYKLLSLKLRKPRILSLGSSRTNQMRANFFKQRQDFYNASQTIERIEDLKFVLRKIPRGSEPDVLLLGLDHWVFNDNWAGNKKELTQSNNRIHNEPFGLFVLLTKWREIYDDFFKKKFSLHDLLSEEKRRNAVGLSALISHRGYRNDGSYCYADVGSDYKVTSETHTEFKHEMGRIASGDNRFEYGDDVSVSALREVEGFLIECRARNIHVIAFLRRLSRMLFMRNYSLTVRNMGICGSYPYPYSLSLNLMALSFTTFLI